jgi:hypothetical protein
MKKAIILGVILVLGITPTYADVYVKVDAQGNAIDGAIMCDPVTCGATSLYSKLTLKEGERYVLQGYGQAGIGNNTPDTQVKVDIPTQVWTVTTPTQESTFTPDQPMSNPISVLPITDSSTVISDTATVLSDTSTATLSLESVNSFESAIAYIRLLLNQIYAIFEKLGIKG